MNIQGTLKITFRDIEVFKISDLLYKKKKKKKILKGQMLKK